AADDLHALAAVQAVGAIGRDGVVAGAAVDRFGAAVPRPDRVVPGTAVEDVPATAANQQVRAGPAVEAIVVGAPVDAVAPRAAAPSGLATRGWWRDPSVWRYATYGMPSSELSTALPSTPESTVPVSIHELPSSARRLTCSTRGELESIHAT